MAKFKDLGTETLHVDAENHKIGIVLTEWNHDIARQMADQAIATLKSFGVIPEHIIEIYVPGAFELPFGAQLLLKKKKLNAILCFGVVIKGETSHDEHINRAVSAGLMQLSITSEKPILFGVLTTSNEQQAVDRANGTKGDKGKECAISALKLIQLNQKFSNQNSKIGFG